MKFGYPPKLLTINDSTAGSTLASLGVKDGEQILTSEKPEGSPATYVFGSTTTTTATSILAPVPTTTTATEAVTPATSAFGASSSGNNLGAFGSRSVLQASQPQQTTASRSSLSEFQAAAARPTTDTFGGLSTVDTSYTSKAATAPVPAPAAPTAASITKGGIASIRIRDQGLLILRVSKFCRLVCFPGSICIFLAYVILNKPLLTFFSLPLVFLHGMQEVEDDNSCLFNAIAYTLDPSMKSNVQGLRQIVAKAIDANPDAYPDVVLGYVLFSFVDA